MVDRPTTTVWSGFPASSAVSLIKELVEEEEKLQTELDAIVGIGFDTYEDRPFIRGTNLLLRE